MAIKYVVRMAGTGLMDDKTSKMVPANREINLEPNRARYLEGMKKVYMPGDENPVTTGTRRRRKKKGLTPIATDPKAEAEAEA